MRPKRPCAHILSRFAPALALIVAVLLAGGLCAQAQTYVAPPAPASQPPAQSVTQSGVQVGLEGARLVDFIRFLGQFLGGPPVLREDQIPPLSVSVVAPEPMAEAEVRELLGLVLRPAGLEVALRGGVFYVLPAPLAPPALSTSPTASPLPTGGPRPPLPPGAQILAWRLPSSASAARAQALAGVLESLRSDRGQALASGRLVVLADEAARVERLRPILQSLSALPPEQSPEIIPLVRVKARQAARALDMQTKGAALTVLPLEWSNSLLLAGTPEALERARALVAQSDGAGPEAPVLKAYRTRHVRPDKVLEALREKLGSLGAFGAGADAPRLSLDPDGQAVLALASPEALAHVDRLVEALDQPRPRVYIEALVAEFSPEALEKLALSGAQGADGSQARVGAGVVLRGSAVDAAQIGMEALSALWAREEGVRVLSVPRLAVFAGAEAAVSGGQMGADAQGQSSGERFRLLMTPWLEPGQAGAAGRVRLRAELADGLEPGQGRAVHVEAALAEGQVLLLGAQGAQAQDKGGWTLFSGPRKAEGPGRLVVVISARVVRPTVPERGLGPSGRSSRSSGRGAPGERNDHRAEEKN